MSGIFYYQVIIEISPLHSISVEMEKTSLKFIEICSISSGVKRNQVSTLKVNQLPITTIFLSDRFTNRKKI